MKRLGLVLALLLCAAGAFAYDYSNKDLGFSVKLPDGLTNVPSPLYSKYLVCLANLHPSKGHPIFEMIVLSDTGELMHQDFSPATNSSLAISLPNPEWNGLTLQVTRETRKIYGETMVSLVCQIPLKPSAIEIRVIGQTSVETQLRADLDTILDSVEGRTNWLTTAESGRGVGPYLICVFVGIFALLVGSLRISPHYGLADSDARVGGFFILLAGLGMPYLDRVYPIAGYLQRFGLGYAGVMAALVALNFLIIIGVTVVMVSINGNLYAEDANPLAYAPAEKANRDFFGRSMGRLIIMLVIFGLTWLFYASPWSQYLNRLGLSRNGVRTVIVTIGMLVYVVVLKCFRISLFRFDSSDVLPSTPKKPTSAPTDRACPLCRIPVSPQHTTCPECHADLTRWKQNAAVTE